MADPVCDKGWAHDPVLRNGSCVMPALGTKVMAIVILLLALNVLRLYAETLWRLWRLNLHASPRCKSTVFSLSGAVSMEILQRPAVSLAPSGSNTIVEPVKKF
jgi:hypothetical protein